MQGNKTPTPEEIINESCLFVYGKSMDDLFTDDGYDSKKFAESIMVEIIKRVSKQEFNRAIELVAENAKIEIIRSGKKLYERTTVNLCGSIISVDKESILKHKLK